MKDSEFVFKEVDGQLRFVGDFDGLYKVNADPWHQSGSGTAVPDADYAAYYAFSRKRIVEVLKHLAPQSALEVGCGKGYALNVIRKCMPLTSWHGMDISPTAVAVARALFPGLHFFVGDIRQLDELLFKVDCIILNQVIWYILEDFGQALVNCISHLNPNGVLVISQAFLKDGEQRYGKHMFDGFYGLDRYMRSMQEQYAKVLPLRMIESRYDDTNDLIFNDGLLAFRKI